jgi:hypothetical protein
MTERAVELAKDAIDYIDALMGADLSYTDLPEDDERKAIATWPLDDSRIVVAAIIERKTWEDELDSLKERLAELQGVPA